MAANIPLPWQSAQDGSPIYQPQDTPWTTPQFSPSSSGDGGEPGLLSGLLGNLFGGVGSLLPMAAQYYTGKQAAEQQADMAKSQAKLAKFMALSEAHKANAAGALANAQVMSSQAASKNLGRNLVIGGAVLGAVVILMAVFRR